MTRDTNNRRIATFLVAATLLAACADSGGSSGTTDAPDDSGSAQTDAPVAAGIPAEPQQVEFQAADGQALQGLYYPAATDAAPVVVLMHWAGGDMSDWYEVAPWMQNRGLVNPFTNPSDEPWWDPTWFPAMPDDMSVGVFTFTFRGCEPFPTGCQGFDPQGWLLDAQAALTQATMLEGADPTRIAAIGSSMGADGAADACFFVNEHTPGTCDGALSLSPGSYLDVAYVNAIETLGAFDPPVPAWCLADANEIALCTEAESAGNSAFQTFEIANGQHGNFLMVPEADPSTMQTIIDFVKFLNVN